MIARQSYTFDAWNRLMTVSHGYRDSSNSLQHRQAAVSKHRNARERQIRKPVACTGARDCTRNKIGTDPAWQNPGVRLASILKTSCVPVPLSAQTVICINFHGLGVYAATHKRAARLLASLRTRADLAQTSLERLTALCQETGIAVEVVDGRIGPLEGREMDFLMLLDRRRYAVSLIDGVDETYEAANRRNVGVAAHPAAGQ